MNAMEIKRDLSLFTGSEEFYRHHLGGSYTDGVKWMAASCSAYWLLDAVFSYLPWVASSGDYFFPVTFEKKRIEKTGLEYWMLTIGSLENPMSWSQEIEFSDFPLDHIKLFLCDNGGELGWTLLLPSEY